MGERRWTIFLSLSLVVPLLWVVPAKAGEPTCFDKNATITGTSGDDVLRGTPKKDVIVGRGGNDRILGREADDYICAGGGDDVVRGGAGSDVVSGGGGSDKIQLGDRALYCIPCSNPPQIGHGNSGHDEITTAHGAQLFGGRGSDRLIGRKFYDMLTGGPGDDVMDGGAGRDRVEFQGAKRGVVVDLADGTARGDGRDRITSVTDVIASRFDDRVVGTAAGNTVFLRGGSDSATLGDGNDYASGDDGDDLLEGGAGDDRLYGQRGVDDIDGGDGTDRTSLFSKGTGVTVDLAAGTSQGSDTERVENIENIVTTRFPDTVLGSDAGNRIVTLGGSDVIDGRGGDDEIWAGGGNNSIDGGAGTDLVVFTNQVEADLQEGTATLTGHSGDSSTDTLAAIESIHVFGGSPTDDTLFGDDGANVLHGGDGADEIDGRGGADEIRGGLVTPPFRCTDVITEYHDGADILRGGPGNDMIHGGSRVGPGGGCTSISDEGDSIFGEGGDDSLFGNGGDDSLDGGPGTDALYGGSGTDECVEGESVASCEGP